jgi:hypothetical protein
MGKIMLIAEITARNIITIVALVVLLLGAEIDI